MKESLIDVKTNENDCLEFVRKTFHLGPTVDTDETDGGMCDVPEKDVDRICHYMFGGLCQRDRYKDAACRLVQIFNRALVENEVPTGSLLLLSTGSDSFIGFLGLQMKKPFLQVFLEAQLDTLSDSIYLHEPSSTLESSELSFCTSHVLFNRLLTDPNEHIEVEVLKYSVHVEGNRMALQSCGVLTKFALDPNAKLTVRKPRTQLRVKWGQKKRKKWDANQQRSGRQPRQKRSDKKEQQVPSSLLPKVEGSDADSDATNGDSSAEGKEHEETNMDDEADIYVPLSKQAEREEKKGNELLLKFEEEREMAEKDVASQAGCTPVAAQEPSSGSKEPPRSSGADKGSAKGAGKGKGGKKGYSSYFSLKLGVHDVDLAASARSTCLYCDAKIARQTPRFSWYHNERKPSAWVHAKCLPFLVQRDGFLAESRCRLEELQLRVPSSSADPLFCAIQTALASLPVP